MCISQDVEVYLQEGGWGDQNLLGAHIEVFKS